MGMFYGCVCCIDGHVLWMGVLYRWAFSMDVCVVYMGMFYGWVCCIDGHVLWMGVLYRWACSMDGCVV
jgi:hypothetical protein